MNGDSPSFHLIPNLKHVAIIMDGNGRWATERGLNRFKGHVKGTEIAELIIEECVRCQISYLTMFAFSTENWSRPKREVDFLFALLEKHLNEKGNKLVEKNIRVETIGDISRLPSSLQRSIQNLKDKSQSNTGLTLIFGLNYGGRNEIVRSILKVLNSPILAEELKTTLDENRFSELLDTAQWPDPDLIIRTSGEERISNFMIWQMAYSEFYFSKLLWPDFTIEELHRAFQIYTRRQRRFGQVQDTSTTVTDMDTPL